MRKRHDWRQRLREHSHEHMPRPFQWGEWDCCSYAASAIEAMTGVNPWPEIGGYSNAREAAVAIRKHGTSGLHALLDMVAGRWGWEEIAPDDAAFGDLVLMTQDAGTKLVLAIQYHEAPIGPSRRGLETSQGQAIAAWRVA